MAKKKVEKKVYNPRTKLWEVVTDWVEVEEYSPPVFDDDWGSSGDSGSDSDWD